MLYSKPLARLIEELEKLPGIGPKSSQRLAFHLIKQSEKAIADLATALVDAKRLTRHCSICANLGADDPCHICTDGTRDGTMICVVSEPRDLIALERPRESRGNYHVLGGLISPLDGIGPEQLKIRELLARMHDGVVTEVILAIAPTVEGEATALLLGRLLKPAGLRVTRIAFGLPMGGDLEYADERTLVKALEGRREF